MGNKNSSKNNLIVQGSILGIASIIVRFIGFFYKIPMLAILDDIGMGDYALAFSIYTLFLMVSSYGLPPAIAKLNAEMIVEKRYKESNRFFKAAILLAIIVGLIAGALLWIGADAIAEFNENPRIVLSLKALAPSVFFFGILAVIRGYFQGYNTMIPTAISQIIEQIFNALFSILLAYLLLSKGLEYGVAGGTLGTGFGTFAGLLVMIFIYYGARKSIIKRQLERDESREDSKSLFVYWKLIIFIAIPLVLSSIITSISAVFDLTFLRKSMSFHNIEQVLLDAYVGVYAFKYLLLINLPVIAVGASLSSTIIPSLTSSLAEKNYDAIKDKVRAVYKVGLIILIPAAIGIFVFARPIIQLLPGDNHIGVATDLLRLGSITIIIIGLSNISAGILLGVNKFRVQVYTTAIAVVIKMVLNAIILYGFGLNIYGIVIANILYSSILFGMKLFFVRKYVGTMIDIKRSLVLPGFAGVIMGVLGYLLYLLFAWILGSGSVALIISIILCIAIYGFIVLRFEIIKEEEIYGMPKGAKLVGLLKRIHML